MSSSIYWIKDSQFTGQLGIMARPRAGDWLDDEIAAWRREGVTSVTSLLEDHEMQELSLLGEAEACAKQAIAFRRFPIVDRGVPASLYRTYELCARINTERMGGQGVAIHCRAGIGRSSLIAAASLVAMGRQVRGAFDLIRTARGVAVPDTPGQAQWVDDFATYVATLRRQSSLPEWSPTRTSRLPE